MAIQMSLNGSVDPISPKPLAKFLQANELEYPHFFAAKGQKYTKAKLYAFSPQLRSIRKALGGEPPILQHSLVWQLLHSLILGESNPGCRATVATSQGRIPWYFCLGHFGIVPGNILSEFGAHTFAGMQASLQIEGVHQNEIQIRLEEVINFAFKSVVKPGEPLTCRAFWPPKRGPRQIAHVIIEKDLVEDPDKKIAAYGSISGLIIVPNRGFTSRAEPEELVPFPFK